METVYLDVFPCNEFNGQFSAKFKVRRVGKTLVYKMPSSSDTAQNYVDNSQPHYISNSSSTTPLSFLCPSFDYASLQEKMENGIVNGNGSANGRPRTPSLNALSLTEYSSNPSPPSAASPKSKIRSVIPGEFVLPNGYPDVCLSLYFQLNKY